MIIQSEARVDPEDRYGPLRLLFRKAVHWASYNFILRSRRTRNLQIGDLRLNVPPSVFHPGVFVTSRMFADFLRTLDLRGKTVAEIGTGSGILALCAARAGARSVLALDINPAAAAAAQQNAKLNGLDAIVSARVSDLMSAVSADESFDVLISSPPSFAGEPRDMADRAWHAGPGYRDLQPLFHQAVAHLTPGGVMYLLLSSDSNIALFESLATEAGFSWHPVARRSIVIESFNIYYLKLK